jgi:hypothetical protein
MRSNIVIAGGLFLFAAIVMSTWKPVDLRPKKNWVTERGVVAEMYQTGFKDLVLKLKGQAESYYIDGALDGDVSLSELKEKLLNKSVVIQYPDRWTPLKDEDTKHFISKLEYDGEVIYHNRERNK